MTLQRPIKKNLVFMIFMVATSIVLMSLSPFSSVSAQTPPIGIFGNPHDFFPGPPIPSCNAHFNQGPPDDTLKACRDTPGKD
jgi:hypothetical protein